MSSGLFKYFSARYSARIFSLSILLGYGLVSLIAYFDTRNETFLQVAWLALLSSVTVCIFSEFSLIKQRIIFPKIVVSPRFLFFSVFGFFTSFAVLVLVTAEAIPLVAWFGGSDAETLVVLREKFLKAREGWQSIFPYVNAVFTGALIPYCLAIFFINGYKWRWLAFVAFLFYSILFIEKVFFLKAMIPLIYVLYCVRQGAVSSFLLISSFCFLVVFFLGVVSGFGSGGEEPAGVFFSGQYRAGGTFNFLLWRAVAVPLFTAADSLSYFIEELNSVPLMGATSGLLSGTLGLDRVYFERSVFEYQWGQASTGTGSANAVYFIDSYVNFGIFGVVLFSALIGYIFKFISRSNDQALHAIWPLFAFGLYVSGLVGNLASNGFLLVFLLSVIVSLRSGRLKRVSRISSVIS